MPLAVIAIGGNSLSQADEEGNIEQQFHNARLTCGSIADVISQGWNVVLTHGNGPQVGNMLRRVELSAETVYRLPLDVLDADAEGGMGYMLQQVLGNVLRARNMGGTVVTLITQVEVDQADPAFENPDKPIGRFYADNEAQERKRSLGWLMTKQGNRGWRRVVPSPLPRRIVELEAIRNSVTAGFIPIALGGGGIPVVQREPGRLQGVEAVIDKDRASALLAHELGADRLIISTAVEAVQVGFGTANAQPLGKVERDVLRSHAAAGEFPPGSMGPKIEAALQFLDAGGSQTKRAVVITDPEHLGAALAGKTGTQIH